MPRAEQRRGVNTTVAHDTLIPDPEGDKTVEQSTAKTVKRSNTKRIFSYKMEGDIGERIRLYARKVADRPVGDVMEQAAREFLERVGG